MSNVCERDRWIDVARGMGILLVVLGHLTNKDVEVGKWIYSFHIPLFFMISGLLLHDYSEWKNVTVRELLFKKMKSLIFPYYMISGINLIYIFISYGKGEVLKNIKRTIMFDGILALWFVPALFFAEILFVLLLKFSHFCAKNAFIALVVLLLISSQLCKVINIYTLGNGWIWILNIINRAFIGTIFVIIGYYCSGISKMNNYAIITLLGICTVSNAILYKYNYADLHYSIIGNPILYYANSFLGGVAVLALAKLLDITSYISRVLAFFGVNSFLIFSTHLNFDIVQIPIIFYMNRGQEITGVALCVSFAIVICIESILVWMFNHNVWLRGLIEYRVFRDNIIKLKKLVKKCVER